MLDQTDRFLGLTQNQELGCVADIFLVQLITYTDLVQNGYFYLKKN
jgi:hypothetical protein